MVMILGSTKPIMAMYKYLGPVKLTKLAKLDFGWLNWAARAKLSMTPVLAFIAPYMNINYQIT